MGRNSSNAGMEASTSLEIGHIVRQFQNGEPPEAIRLHYPTLSLERRYHLLLAIWATRKWRGTERESEEEDYNRMHPTPREIKEKFARMRKQMLARKG